MTKLWSYALTAPETKDGCAGEGQQQFTGLDTQNVLAPSTFYDAIAMETTRSFECSFINCIIIYWFVNAACWQVTHRVACEQLCMPPLYSFRQHDARRGFFVFKKSSLCQLYFISLSTVSWVRGEVFNVIRYEGDAVRGYCDIGEPWQLSRYSDWIWTGRPRGRSTSPGTGKVLAVP
jgi:hypothetical protein